MYVLGWKSFNPSLYELGEIYAKIDYSDVWDG